MRPLPPSRRPPGRRDGQAGLQATPRRDLAAAPPDLDALTPVPAANDGPAAYPA